MAERRYGWAKKNLFVKPDNLLGHYTLTRHRRPHSAKNLTTRFTYESQRLCGHLPNPSGYRTTIAARRSGCQEPELI